MHVDARYPDLVQSLVLEASEERAGDSGGPGQGGDANQSSDWSGSPSRAAALHGQAGARGLSGKNGSDGTTTLVVDDVSDHFPERYPIRPF